MIRQKLISIICIVLWVIVLVPAAAKAEAWVLWSKNELLSYDKGGVSNAFRGSSRPGNRGKSYGAIPKTRRLRRWTERNRIC